jgi:DNA-directed RNA polymerase subunit M/transcription elongation factor TFIIS
MDYTLSTVKLLLERDRSYLMEILDKLGIDVHENEAITAENIVKLISNQDEQKPVAHESSIYVCKCGSRSVTTKEVQLRSADEGSSIINFCRTCGHKWQN